MNVVEMAHETQKTGFEIHNPKDRRWVNNTLRQHIDIALCIHHAPAQ